MAKSDPSDRSRTGDRLLADNRKQLRRLLIGDFTPLRLVRSLLFIYASICLYAFFFTDRQIFLPPASSYQETSDLIKLNSSPDIAITALHLPNPKATYTILYSHGNAEDLGQVRPLLELLRSQGFAVFAYDYRGYGTSEGTPSERNAYADINAAYRYLTQKLNIPPQKIIAYGRSVGGGPAVDLAAREPLAGLILESTFISAFRVVTHIPIVPFDKFSNLSKLNKVRCPVLIVHGTNDQTIPLHHGQQLYQAANEPKQFLAVEGADHYDTVEIAGDAYRQSLQTFSQLLRESER